MKIPTIHLNKPYSTVTGHHQSLRLPSCRRHTHHSLHFCLVLSWPPALVEGGLDPNQAPLVDSPLAGGADERSQCAAPARSTGGSGLRSAAPAGWTGAAGGVPLTNGSGLRSAASARWTSGAGRAGLTGGAGVRRGRWLDKGRH